MFKYSWMNPNLEVKNSGRERTYKGVFAKVFISANERLAIFGGRLVRVVDEIGDYGIQVSEDFVINALDKETEEMEDAFFFNHSCDPNAGIKGQIILVAMRDIQKDEEITFDYATCLHETQGVAPYCMECHCNKSNCRSIITDTDWKIPVLQKKYDGWFSWYLQEKIKKLRKRDGS